MTIQPVLVAIPAPSANDPTCGPGPTDAAGGLSTEPQALACAKSQRSGVSRTLKPAAQEFGWRTPQRVIQQRAYARIALRECARRCGAPAEGWEKGLDEAPLPNDGFYWSVSHKRVWAAAVIADRPVGIDIERIVPRHEGVFGELASDDEWNLLGDRSWRSFFRLWTAKEATLKANGVGIGKFAGCRLVRVPDDRHLDLVYEDVSWHVEHYRHADHIVAVTCVGAGIEWQLLRSTRQE